jgi:hypothetical protein
MSKKEKDFWNLEEASVSEINEAKGRPALPIDQSPDAIREATEEEDDVIHIEESEEKHKIKTGEAFIPVEEIPDDAGQFEKDLINAIDAKDKGKLADDAEQELISRFFEDYNGSDIDMKSKRIFPKELKGIIGKKIRENSVSGRAWAKMSPARKKEILAAQQKVIFEVFDDHRKVQTHRMSQDEFDAKYGA